MKKMILCLFTGFATTRPGNAGSEIGTRFKKVIWVIFENTNYATAVKQSDFKAVAAQGALFTNFNAETHPSQANYIAMVAGSTLGVQGDSSVDLNARHLGDLFEAAKLDWKVFAEDYPGNCFTDDQSNNYVRKHNPFISFTDVNRNQARCASHIVDAKAFDADLASDSLPALSLYIPNLLNDGHDTDADYAGKFLSARFAQTISSPDFMKDKLFIVTFDESESFFGNRIYTAVVGGSVIPGSTNADPVNHVSLLRMIEDEFSLGTLGQADVAVRTIQGIWR